MGGRGAVVFDADCTEQREIADSGLDELRIDPLVWDYAQAVTVSEALARASWWGCGTEDPRISRAELVDLDQSALSLDGLSHNLHVEAPGRVAEMILTSRRATA